MFEDFDYHQEKLFLERQRHKVNMWRTQIVEGRQINKERAQLQEKYVKVKELEQTLQLVMAAMKQLYEKTLSEDIAFKDRRMDFLNARITEALAIIFPEDKFQAKVTIDRNRGMRSKLVLIDRFGRKRKPHINEGKLLQSQISYGSAIAIAEGLGINKIYLDEAFAASSPSNLTKIANTITKSALEKGFQIVMVEQYSGGYKDLPRREIHIQKDPHTETTSVIKVLDY